MNTLVLLLQNTDVNQKLKEAPDSGYAIGVFIGTILPFLVLVVIAYTIYRSRKNRLKDN